MKPKNTEQRNKMIFRFAGFYIASIVLIIIIFSAFTDRSLPVQQNQTVSLVEKPADAATLFEQEQVLNEAWLLYAPLKNLQQLEENFIGLLKDSADLPKLETARQTITANKKEFKKTVDSIERGAVKYKSKINANLLEQSIAFSRLALNNRDDWYKMQTAALPRQTPVKDLQVDKQTVDGESVDKQTIIRWQNEVSKKNERVSDLESQLKSLQMENRTLRTADGQSVDKQTIVRWQKEVSKKNERVSDLESQLKSLQRENRSLRLALTNN